MEHADVIYRYNLTSSLSLDSAPVAVIIIDLQFGLVLFRLYSRSCHRDRPAQQVLSPILPVRFRILLAEADSPYTIFWRCLTATGNARISAPSHSSPSRPLGSRRDNTHLHQFPITCIKQFLPQTCLLALRELQVVPLLHDLLLV